MPEPKEYPAHNEETPSPYDSTQQLPKEKEFAAVDLQHFVQTLKEDRKGAKTVKGNKVNSNRAVQPKFTKKRR
jgi:hypothetical protein